MTTNDTNRAFKKIGFILLLIIIVFYSYFQARKILSGPKIDITSPQNGATLYEPLATIEGVAKNINSIKMNDGPIFIDRDGAFSEKLVLYEGYNIIKFEAKDRFGKSFTKLLELTLKGSENSSETKDDSGGEEATTTNTTR